MTVDELYEELKKLRNDGEGCLNVAFRNECVERGMSRVDKIHVLVDNDYIGKFVLLDTKDENMKSLNVVKTSENEE